MKIPNFERLQFTDKDGFLSDHWNKILESLFRELKKNFSEGTTVSHQATSAITDLSGVEKSGALFYDTDTKKLKVNLDGVIKEISTV